MAAVIAMNTLYQRLGVTAGAAALITGDQGLIASRSFVYYKIARLRYFASCCVAREERWPTLLPDKEAHPQW